MFYRFAVLLAGVAALSPVPVFSQSSNSLSARELFYTPPPKAQPDRVSPKAPSRKNAPAKADIAKADSPVVPQRAPRKPVRRLCKLTRRYIVARGISVCPLIPIS